MSPAIPGRDADLVEEHHRRHPVKALELVGEREACRLSLQVGDEEVVVLIGKEATDRFLLDGRCLELRRREGASLLVEEVPGRPQVPHWAGEGLPLSPELARRLYVLRMQAAAVSRSAPKTATAGPTSAARAATALKAAA